MWKKSCTSCREITKTSNTIKETIRVCVLSVSPSFFVRNTHLQKSLMRGVRRSGGWARESGQLEGRAKNILPKIFSLKIFLSKIFLPKKITKNISEKGFLPKIFPKKYFCQIFFKKKGGGEAHFAARRA